MYPQPHIRVEGLSPVAAMAHGDGFGMASPGPMSPEPPPAGPQARIGRRVSCTAQDFSYAATDATAHSNVNPFPMHAGVTGAQLGYYSAHAHPHAQASHAHPQVHFDPQSSSFTIPSGGGSGGGAGESPDLDGGLPNGSRRRSSAGVKGVAMRLRHIFVHKGRPTKWVAALAATALMMAVLLVVAFRSRGGGASGVTAAADSYQRAAPARTPVVMATTTARPQRAAADGVAANPGTVQEEELALAASAAANRRAKAAISSAATPTAGAASKSSASSPASAKRSSSSSSEGADDQLTLLDKGLAEIARLKANIKEMKTRIKEQAAAAAGVVRKDEVKAKEKSGPGSEGNVASVAESESKKKASAVPVADDTDDDDAGSFHRSGSVSGDDAGPPKTAISSVKSVDEQGGYFDYFVSDWSECSASVGEGIRTRNIICQHTRTGERAPLRVCTAVEAAPKDVIPCFGEEEPAKAKKASDAEASEHADADDTEAAPAAATAAAEPATPAPSVPWPTLSQYSPPWFDPSIEPNSCPATRWGRDFIEGGFWLDGGEMLCGVDSNAHEHASVELVRLPEENLAHLGQFMSPEQIVASQVSDSFYRIKHALFHPEPTRYTASSKSPQKMDEVNTEESFALSLDCTAVGALRSRAHSDPTTASFLRSLRHLNPAAPPLVTPSDPKSPSIFTRAFERMTDAEFDSTTFFVHRNCQPPHSAAQCMPDLFAVFAIAHALKVEFSTIRIVFLDAGESDPYLSAWQRLSAPGQVFTRSQWSSLRVAPFDNDDVYLTNAVFVVPSAVETLFSLGETVFQLPLRLEEKAAKAQRCAGKSALHVAFNRLMSDVYSGFGSHVVKESAEESQAPPVLVLAEGGGGVQLPAPSAPTSDFARHHADHGAVVKLHHSGRRIRHMDGLRSDVSAAYPALRMHAYPQHGAFATQLGLLTHANALLAVRHSVAFNTLLFVSQPQKLHVIEAVGESEVRRDSKIRGVPSGSDESVAEQELTLATSQGLDWAGALAARQTSSFAVQPVSPAPHAVFNARWLCDRIGCASYNEVAAKEVRDDHDIDALQIDSARLVEVMTELRPPVPNLPAPQQIGADASKAAGGEGEASKAAASVASEAAALEEYVPSAEEVAAEEAAAAAAAQAKAKAKSIAKAKAKAMAASRALEEQQHLEQMQKQQQQQRQTAPAKGPAAAPAAGAPVARQHQHAHGKIAKAPQAQPAAVNKAAPAPASTAKAKAPRSRLSRRYQQKARGSN